MHRADAGIVAKKKAMRGVVERFLYIRHRHPQHMQIDQLVTSMSFSIWMVWAHKAGALYGSGRQSAPHMFHKPEPETPKRVQE